MKRLLLLSLLTLIACASGNNKRTAQIPEPEISIVQESGPAELNFPTGPFDVKYTLEIHDKWTQPLTLTRINIMTLNMPGGPYSVPRRFYNLQATIPPNETRNVTFWVHAIGYGRGMRETEPVSVRAIVYFDTPVGPTQKVFVAELPQMP